MILAHHLIFGAYGFWLPNDPRGSWSDYIRNYELLQFGRATTVRTARSLAHRDHDRRQRLAARQALMYPPVRFTGRQALSVAAGFGAKAGKSGYTIYACAIMPDHVHLVVKRHTYHAEQIMNMLKGAATTQLNDDNLHPLARFEPRPSPWAVSGWKVFLDCEAHIRRAVEYVEDNPVRAGYKKQNWSFVSRREPGPAGPR